MSTNCLITELKGVVENDSMEEFGIIKVICEPGECEFQLGLASGTVITCDNSVDTIRMGSTVLSFPYIVGNISEGDFIQKIIGTLTRKTTFKFDNLYNNRCVTLYNNPMTQSITKSALEIGISGNDDFRYLRIDSNYIAKDYIVDLSVLENKAKLNLISLTGTAKGDISAFNGTHTYLNKVEVSYCSLVYGNINSFAGCIALTNLSGQSSEHLSGTIEDLVEKMCANGRTSGTMVTNFNYTDVTFNGSGIGQIKIIFSNTGATVTNNSDVLMATYTKSNNSWSYV